MNNLRLFIDIPLEPALAKQLAKQFSQLKLPWDKLKKVKPEQMHITLKFLGETSLNDLPKIIEALQAISSRIGTIDLNIDKVNVFNPNNPRVLILSIEADSKLQDLYHNIEETLYMAGLANKEMKKFKAHLTLARIKQKASLEELKDFFAWQPHGMWQANHFELQESVLGRLGPEYNIMQTFEL